jgi:predicted protein tyrosine phosphatase
MPWRLCNIEPHRKAAAVKPFFVIYWTSKGRRRSTVVFYIVISPLTHEMLEFAESGAPEGVALISIMSQQKDCTERYPAPRVLRLFFDDATEESWWQNLMTEEQADAIFAFVMRYGPMIDDLIVHCSAGVSRSPAVAAGILAGLGQDDSAIWNSSEYQPNPYVYRQVCEAFARGMRRRKNRLRWRKAAR